MTENIALLSEREIFSRTFRSGISHTLWFGLGAVVTWFIGRLSWRVGAIFFVTYALLMGAGFLWVFGTTILPDFVAVLDAIGSRLRGDRKGLGKAGYILGDLMIGLIEAAAGMVVLLFLFNFYLKSARG